MFYQEESEKWLTAKFFRLLHLSLLHRGKSLGEIDFLCITCFQTKKERRTKSCHFSNPHFVVVKYRKIHSKALCASLIKSYLWTCVKIDLALENCKFTMIQKFIFLSFFSGITNYLHFMPKLINHFWGVLKNHYFFFGLKIKFVRSVRYYQTLRATIAPVNLYELFIFVPQARIRDYS